MEMYNGMPIHGTKDEKQILRFREPSISSKKPRKKKRSKFDKRSWIDHNSTNNKGYRNDG
jgi:hypothetical protein